MKNLFKILPLILLSAVLISPIGPVACKNPQKTALVATSVTTQTVDGAIGLFDEWEQVHPVPVETTRKVRDLAKIYKQAVITSRAAQTAYYKALASGVGADEKKREWDAAIGAVESAGPPLVDLIATIVPTVVKTKK